MFPIEYVRNLPVYKFIENSDVDDDIKQRALLKLINMPEAALINPASASIMNAISWATLRGDEWEMPHGKVDIFHWLYCALESRLPMNRNRCEGVNDEP